MTIERPKPYTNPAIKLSGCSECGKGGAPITTIVLGDEALSGYAHPECVETIQTRFAEWLASVEGRIAVARDAGLTPCNHCGTTEDVHNWQTPDGNTGHLCLGCAIKVENAGHLIEAAPTAEQLRVAAAWDAAGIGAN